MQITIDVPDQLAEHLPGDSAGLARRMLEDAALGAYCRDAITSRELQAILGFETQDQVDGFLKRLGVDHGSYGKQDFVDDLESFRRAGFENGVAGA